MRTTSQFDSLLVNTSQLSDRAQWPSASVGSVWYLR